MVREDIAGWVMLEMIIVVDELPGTAPQEIIDSHCRRFERKGHKVKTERKGNIIEIFIEEIFD